MVAQAEANYADKASADGAEAAGCLEASADACLSVDLGLRSDRSIVSEGMADLVLVSRMLSILLPWFMGDLGLDFGAEGFHEKSP